MELIRSHQRLHWARTIMRNLQTLWDYEMEFKLQLQLSPQHWKPGETNKPIIYWKI